MSEFPSEQFPQALIEQVPFDVPTAPNPVQAPQYSGRQFGIPGTERMPDYFYAKTESGRIEFDEAHMLGQLRTELQFSERNEDLVRHAYAVVRNIGDMTISDQGENGQEAFGLLDATRDYARPIAWETRAEAGSLGSHNRTYKRFSVAHEQILGEGQDSHSQAIEAAIELKHPQDAELLSYLGTVGHEAGHALLGGVSTLIEQNNSFLQRDGLTASLVYMGQHPEQGFTGNLQTDLSIQEERFAEGYGRMIVSRAMELLGYDADDIAKVMPAIKYRADVSGEAGTNQLDYLDQPNIKTGIGKHLKAAQPEASERQHYEGELGYAGPLSLESITAELAELSMLIKTHPREMPASSMQVYAEQQAAGRAPDVTAHINWLKQKRQEYLNLGEHSAEAPLKTRRQRIAHKVAQRFVKSTAARR